MHINEVLSNFYLPIGGNCFVIDKETQRSQNISAPVWLHSFITPTSLHFEVFKNC